jgi:DNA-binding TFAR19-related protein (PDSD5 family)
VTTEATNRNDGREFERLCLSLARGYGNVEPEQLTGSKKADGVLTRFTFGRATRVAIECKDWSSPLSKDELVKTIFQYQGLVKSGKLESVLLVTRNGLSPAAVTLASETGWLFPMTIRDLQLDVFDLEPHWESIAHEATAFRLNDTFVDVHLEGFGPALIYLTRWSEQDHAMPAVAILGAYGSGKSTLALRFAQKLVEKRRTTSEGRLPLLIKLGDFAAEQTLEGLVGRQLTAVTAAKGYSFSQFMRLNEEGFFTIILDGFDEMKKFLTWDGFRYNLAQLNRLVRPNSRVVLLGRATAFLDDTEYRYALRSEKLLGTGKVALVPDGVRYQEVTMEPFSNEQVHEFLKKVIDPKAFERLERAILAHREIRELTRRPVHLKMLADIAPQMSFRQLEALDLVSLYDEFVDLTLVRESQKLNRDAVSTAKRREFAEELAAFLWQTPLTEQFTASQIPEDMVSKYSNNEDIDAIRRDLAAACMLERRFGERLAFAHRSFQEFLVACWTVKQLKSGAYEDKEGTVTVEVAHFMAGLLGDNDHKKILLGIARQPSPRLSPELSSWICSAITLKALEDVVHEFPTPKMFRLLCEYLNEKPDQKVDVPGLLILQRDARDPVTALLAFAAVCLCRQHKVSNLRDGLVGLAEFGQPRKSEGKPFDKKSASVEIADFLRAINLDRLSVSMRPANAILSRLVFGPVPQVEAFNQRFELSQEEADRIKKYRNQAP